MRLGILTAAFWPVWSWWGIRVLGDAESASGLFALAAATYLLHSSDSRIAGPHLRPPSPVTLLLLLTYVLTYPFLLPMPRAMIALSVLTIEIFRARRQPFHFGIWLLILMALPIGPSLQFFIGYPLRAFVAGAASLILNIYGFAVTREGAVLHAAGHILLVDAPCSGLRMLWTGIVAILTLGTMYRLGWRQQIFLLIGGGGVVIVVNVIRAVTLFLAEVHGRRLEGWRHDAVGLLVFTGAIILIAAMGRKLRRTSCIASS